MLGWVVVGLGFWQKTPGPAHTMLSSLNWKQILFSTDYLTPCMRILFYPPFTLQTDSGKEFICSLCKVYARLDGVVGVCKVIHIDTERQECVQLSITFLQKLPKCYSISTLCRYIFDSLPGRGVNPGFAGCTPGKVSGLQVDSDSFNSSSACPSLLVYSWPSSFN